MYFRNSKIETFNNLPKYGVFAMVGYIPINVLIYGFTNHLRYSRLHISELSEVKHGADEAK